MVRSKNTPATSTKIAPSATSSRRLIDQAMSFSIMAGAPLPWRASASAHVQAHPHLEHESLNRCGEVRLRVEQERRRRHDFVARLQALDDLHERVAAEPYTN